MLKVSVKIIFYTLASEPAYVIPVNAFLNRLNVLLSNFASLALNHTSNHLVKACFTLDNFDLVIVLSSRNSILKLQILWSELTSKNSLKDSGSLLYLALCIHRTRAFGLL